MDQAYERNVPLVPITFAVDTGTTDYVLTTTAFPYKSLGVLDYASSVTPTAIVPDPAYANSTFYFKGQIVMDGGNYYSAKADFTTSTASLNTAEWNLIDVAALAATEYRMYGLYMLKNSAGAYKVFLACGAKQTIPSDGKNIVKGNVSSLPGHLEAVLIARFCLFGAVTPGTTVLVEGTNAITYGTFGNTGT